MPEKSPTWLPELEKWEKAEYDGIKGSPPEWVPQPYKHKFLSARNTLFRMTMEKDGEYHELKSRLDKLVTEKYYRIVQALMKEEYIKVYDESLFILADLYKIFSLEPEEGLKKLAGEDAARGHKTANSARQGGKVRAAKFVPEKERAKQAAEKILATRTRKPSKSELARLVVEEIYSEMNNEEKKRKADSLRHWL